MSATALLSWLTSVALLALVAELASRRFRDRPALAHALWLVVLARCLVPSVPLLEAWSVTEPIGRLASQSPRLLTAPVTLGGREWGSLHTLDLALLAWALGTLWCLARAIKGSLVLRRCLRFAHPADAELRAQVDRAAARLGVRAPAVVTLSWIQSPFLFGLRRPVLVWPESNDAVVASARSAVLLHELAHLERRDPLTSCIESLARALWWWNPLVWYAVAQSRRFKELACDARAMAEQPDERNLYASALIRAIQLRSPSVLAAQSHGWIGSGSRFRERLRALYANPTSRLSASGLALVATAFLASLPGLTHASATPTATLDDAARAALERFDVASFDELEARAEARIAVDPTDGRAFYELGWALSARGDFAGAAVQFERQYELGSTTTFASYNVACCYARLARTDDALDWLVKSIESGYTDAEAIEADPDLASLRDDARFRSLMSDLREQAQSALPGDASDSESASSDLSK